MTFAYAPFSAYCPVSKIGEVNRALDEAGYGPDSFSVPLRDGSEGATHAGLHTWGPQAFRDALAAMPDVVIRDDGDDRPVDSFASLTTGDALEWSDPSDWFVSPIMKGDQRTFDGKTWRSLVDNNVWQPPVAWREVADFPDWVQPTGAHDAYPEGFEVSHDGKHWRSLIPANTTEPGSDPRWWEDLSGGDQTEWAPGQSVTVGDLRTYQGTTYRCRQSHNTQVGWHPPAVPALWEVA